MFNSGHLFSTQHRTRQLSQTAKLPGVQQPLRNFGVRKILFSENKDKICTFEEISGEYLLNLWTRLSNSKWPLLGKEMATFHGGTWSENGSSQCLADYPVKHHPTTGETIFNCQTKMMIKIAKMARWPTSAGIYRICQYMHIRAAGEHMTVSEHIKITLQWVKCAHEHFMLFRGSRVQHEQAEGLRTKHGHQSPPSIPKACSKLGKPICRSR